MTKFYDYLTEKENLEEEYNNLKKSIEKKCQPFLKEFKNISELIFRGYIPGISRPLFQRKPVRKDRKPRFIPTFAHEDLGSFLKKRFGWNARTEGVFTADDYKASFFGNDNIFIFIPIGKYEYIWTDGIQRDNLYDLYDLLSLRFKYETKESILDNENLNYLYNKNINNIKEIFKNNYLNKGLNNYLKKENVEFESIFKCDSFYLIKNKYIMINNVKYGIDELLINDLF